MKNLLKLFLYVSLTASIFISCKKDHEAVVTAPVVAMGKVTGKIVAANNTTAIKVATVFTHNQGHLYLTQSDVNGNFTLEVPAGNQHITIQTGDGSMFRTELDAVITEGQTTQLAGQSIVLNQVATLAYITGTYDKIENILVDSMGYTATPITWIMVHNMADITPYDAIFINCTSESNMLQVDSITDSNLANYVANGGSLYISDWAVKCLVGKHDVSSAPCSVERVGGFIADSLLCVRKSGTTATVTNAPITSASLQAYLNDSTIHEIVYNLGAWEKINYLDANFWETMVTDPSGNPLLIRTNQYTNPYKGTLTVGSSLNNGYSQVCVPGSGNQRITLSVRSSDVPALVAAGAVSGMCDNINGSGRIYYTTFHNEPNGHIDADIRNILEYVILDL
jgi:hypothetical protein